MNDPIPSQAPSLPPEKKPDLWWKWLLWIIAAGIMPGFSMAIAETDRSADAQSAAVFLFLLALLAQIVCSTFLGMAIAKRLGKGTGIAVLFVFVLLIGSVAVGTISWFAGCALAGSKMNFH